MNRSGCRQDPSHVVDRADGSFEPGERQRAAIVATLVRSALAYQVHILHRRLWVWVTWSKIKAVGEIEVLELLQSPGPREARRIGPALVHDERFLDPSEEGTRTKIIILEDWFSKRARMTI